MLYWLKSMWYYGNTNTTGVGNQYFRIDITFDNTAISEVDILFLKFVKFSHITVYGLRHICAKVVRLYLVRLDSETQPYTYKVVKSGAN